MSTSRLSEGSIASEAGPHKLVYVGRLAVLAAAGYFLLWYSSLAAAFLAIALWLPFEPQLPRWGRIACAVLAVLLIAGSVYILSNKGFIGYRLAHGVTYVTPPFQGPNDSNISVTFGPGEGYTKHLLPRLVYEYYEGPYSVGIAVYDEQEYAKRGKVIDARIWSEDEEQKIELDMREHFDDAKGHLISEDGWISFTGRRKGFGPNGAPSEYRVGHVGSGADLRALGSTLKMEFTLLLDYGDEVVKKTYSVVIRADHVGSSSITVHS